MSSFEMEPGWEYKHRSNLIHQECKTGHYSQKFSTIYEDLLDYVHPSDSMRQVAFISAHERMKLRELHLTQKWSTSSYRRYLKAQQVCKGKDPDQSIDAVSDATYCSARLEHEGDEFRELGNMEDATKKYNEAIDLQIKFFRAYNVTVAYLQRKIAVIQAISKVKDTCGYVSIVWKDADLLFNPIKNRIGITALDRLLDESDIQTIRGGDKLVCNLDYLGACSAYLSVNKTSKGRSNGINSKDDDVAFQKPVKRPHCASNEQDSSKHDNTSKKRKVHCGGGGDDTQLKIAATTSKEGTGSPQRPQVSMVPSSKTTYAGHSVASLPTHLHGAVNEGPPLIRGAIIQGGRKEYESAQFKQEETDCNRNNGRIANPPSAKTNLLSKNSKTQTKSIVMGRKVMVSVSKSPKNARNSNKKGADDDDHGLPRGATGTKNDQNSNFPSSEKKNTDGTMDFNKMGESPQTKVTQEASKSPKAPTGRPTGEPTAEPTAGPPAGPTTGPKISPAGRPTGGPTAVPPAGPPAGPTTGPTSYPAGRPTGGPTTVPTAGPPTNSDNDRSMQAIISNASDISQMTNECVAAHQDHSLSLKTVACILFANLILTTLVVGVVFVACIKQGNGFLGIQKYVQAHQEEEGIIDKVETFFDALCKYSPIKISIGK